MSRRLKGVAKSFLRAGVSLTLFAWLLSQQDRGQLLAALKAMSPEAFLPAFSMYLFSQVVSARRWQIISRSLGFQGNFLTYLKYYFVGMYFNLFLPTGVGGDFLKVIYLTRDRPEKLKATYTVLIDRALGVGAMIGIGGLATFFLTSPLPHHFTLFLQGVGASVLMALALSRAISPLKGFLSILEKPNTLKVAFLYSITIQGLGMGSIAVLGHGMGLDVEISYYFAMFPLVALAILLPISFNGIGVREGGFIYFMGLRGIPQEKALTLSLWFFGIQVVSSLVGGAVYGLGLHRNLHSRSGHNENTLQL